MPCPPEIAEAITMILAWGLLRIRSLGWSGQADRCAAEADHLHNLPRLLSDYSPGRWRYYWDFERTNYLARLSPDERTAWDPLWNWLQQSPDETAPGTVAEAKN
jgi:hypothetical protein